MLSHTRMLSLSNAFATEKFQISKLSHPLHPHFSGWYPLDLDRYEGIGSREARTIHFSIEKVFTVRLMP